MDVLRLTDVGSSSIGSILLQLLIYEELALYYNVSKHMKTTT